MKRLVLLTLTFCFVTVVCSQKLNYPSLNSVVDEFDKLYKVKNSVVQLELSKEPKGWFIIKKGFKNSVYQTLDKQLFWSREKSDFVPLDYQPKNDGKKKRKKTLRSFITKNGYNIYGYERQYYYNYTFDNKHTIEALGNKKNLSDSLLEALARAYSNYARPLNDITIKNYPSLAPILVTEKVPENYADTFVKYVDLGIATYKRLYMQNPYYETMVGNIFIKYSNEYMYAFLMLNEWGYGDKAEKYLKEGLYGDAFLSYSKNYLAGVEDNSIVITNGDNDTYPLLYLQLNKGIKPNVNIINSSLLGLGTYINMIRNGYSQFSPIPLSVKQEAYNSKFTDYALTSNSNNKVSTTQELINYINNNSNSRLKFSLKKTKLSIPVNTSACIINNLLSPNNQIDSIYLSLNQYIYRNSIAILDIIYTNDWQRPIYFSSRGNNSPVNLNPYLKNTGLMPVLSPTKSDLNTYSVLKNDSNRLYKNLMTNYSFNTDYIFTGAKGQGFKINAYGLRNAYAFFNKTNISKEKLKKVTLKGLDIIPNSYTPYGKACIVLADNLAQFNPEKAEKTLITIVSNLNNDFKNPKPLRAFFYSKENEKEQFKNILETITNLSLPWAGDAIKSALVESTSDLDTDNKK